MKRYTVKKNYISLAISKILSYEQKTLQVFIIGNFETIGLEFQNKIPVDKVLPYSSIVYINHRDT